MATNIKVITLLNAFKDPVHVEVYIDNEISISATSAHCKLLAERGDTRFDRRIKKLDMCILGYHTPSATLSIWA